MNKQLNIIILPVLFLTVLLSSAQQDAQYTQYMYNTISVNPAYAGSREVLSVVGLHRSQWVGLDGAPRTQTLTLNTPINFSKDIGLGVSIINDEIGPSKETYFDIDFSYTIPVSREGKLSFGIKAGGHLLNVNLQELTKFNENDVAFENNIDNKFSPNIGAGIYYRTNRFYLGLSAPNLLETDHFDESTINNNTVSFLAEERINYYLIAGHVFDLSDDVKFKPAVLGKLVLGTPLQVDVSANFLLYDRLTLGAAYRWDAAMSGMIGFQISNTMMIGFAYDKETTTLGKTQFNNGSYEIMLRFELFKKYDRILTPRFF